MGDCWDAIDKFKDRRTDEEKQQCDLVTVHRGDFYPFATYSGLVYCTRIIFKNVRKAHIIIDYDCKIIPRVLGKIVCSAMIDRMCKVAYRNTVPSFYESSPSLAGPMGIHEHLVDGSSMHHDLTTIKPFLLMACNPCSDIYIELVDCEGTEFEVKTDKDIVHIADANYLKEHIFVH